LLREVRLISCEADIAIKDVALTSDHFDFQSYYDFARIGNAAFSVC